MNNRRLGLLVLALGALGSPISWSASHGNAASGKDSRADSTQIVREAPAETPAPAAESSFWGWLGGDKKNETKKIADKDASAGKIESVSKSSDVTTKRYVTSRYLNSQFASHRGSVLKGKGQVIIDAANAANVDPVFLAAAMSFETGYGTSKKIRTQNNPGGLTGRGGRYSAFKTLDEGIFTMARHLRSGYINKGIKTVAGIARVYAPPGAKNDPGRTNASWPGNVRDIMNKFIRGSVNMKGT